VTSPPYYGLRDYGTGAWSGGNPDCQHIVGEIRTGLGMAALSEDWKGGGKKTSEPKAIMAKGECPHCGARRTDSQIGLEPTPEEYINELVGVFRAVNRVLREDGTLWLNIGDSYSRSPLKGGSGPGGKNEDRWGYGAAKSAQAGSSDGGVGRGDRPGSRSGGLGEKQLLGIPWRVALALQSDGWFLRQDIIWHKPNPMPESVKDRCTKSHEYLFLFSKRPHYYFDGEAIKEDAIYSPGKTTEVEREKGYYGGKWSQPADGSRNDGSFKAIREKRNKRSVWTVATRPFKEAHFATFPPELIEPCILAGCPVLGTVLDPFGGAGTTGLVAERLGRNSIMCELNPEYASMARTRITAEAPMLTEIV
jgi:DNA modification methylase